MPRLAPSAGRNGLAEQLPQRRHISPVIARLVDGRLEYERARSQMPVIQHSPERFEANLAFADVLVPINARAKCRFRIIHVNYVDVGQSNRRLDPLERPLELGLARNTVARRKKVSSVDAHSHRQIAAEIENRL